MKEKMRRRRTSSDSLPRIAEDIAELRQQLDTAGDESIADEAQAIVNEDAADISEGTSTDETVKQDASEFLEQNDKSNDNWPVDVDESAVKASEKNTEVAKALLKCAKILLSEVEEIGDEEKPSTEHEPED